ncbi:AraC family transcriptional regulator [Bacillus sp. 03113]|uniref:AraC family transcriptional regulator n=1 Tax=Bacillus sp. 03113 TaxID=2578211 RepID=UPI0011422D44|nr:AraC family transcriptional regulator [Bacillus sp. 03113]
MTESRKKIVCEKRIYSGEKNTHSHSYFQLLLPLKGAMQIETKDLRTELKSDHLFLITPNSTHSFYSDVRNEFLVLDLPESSIPAKFRKQKLGDQCLTLDKKWESIRYLLLNESQNNDGANHRLHTLMEYASEFLFHSGNKSPSVEYLHQNYYEKITVEQLAEIENFHPFYYTQWFKNKFGMSPSEYIQFLRMEKAKQLLRETDFTILEIALEVGYNQASSLTRLFLKLYNTTPKDYRLSHKKETKTSLI